MHTPHRMVSLCLAVLFATSAHSTLASSTATEFTVQAAYQSALALNPALQAQHKRLESLQSKVQAAHALTAQPPTLEGAYRTDRSHNNQGVREVELGISAPLWHWNEQSRTQALRSSELQAEAQRLEQHKLELAGEVRQLCWNTLSAHLDVQIAHTRATAAQTLLDDITRRVNAGELAQTDVYQAKALLAQAQSDISRTLGVLADLSAEFSSLTGLPASVLERLLPENAPVPEALRPLDHPSLQLAKVQLQVQNQQEALLRTQARNNPEVGLSIVSERAGFGMPNEKSMVLSTRIPLDNASEYQSRVLDAQANTLSAEVALSKAERSVLTKGRAAAGSVDVFEQLRNSSQEQADLAQQVYALQRKSFALGETDLPTLLRHEQQAFESSRLAHKANIEYAAKVSAYKQALGLLPE